MIVQLAASQPSAMARKSAILVEDRTCPSWDALPRFTGGESTRPTKRFRAPSFPSQGTFSSRSACANVASASSNEGGSERNIVRICA